jgi:ribosomal-protein-alanine N-acetyltransferase
LNALAAIRAMQERDVEPVLAIQSASPEIAQWTAQAYRIAAGPDTLAWVAESDQKVVGFLVARQLFDEIEILNLAVAPDFRRSGLATLLLREAFSLAHKHGASKAHLEVRASNQPALEFYKRHGFVETGRRPRYYSAPVEDALLLSTDLASTQH